MSKFGVEPYHIEDKEEALDYLRSLLAKPKYRSECELIWRAVNLVWDEDLRKYFIDEGRKMLKSPYM